MAAVLACGPEAVLSHGSAAALWELRPPEQQLRHALEEAERRELLDGRKLEELLARSPGRRGSRALREALAQLKGPAPWTQSELERRFLGLIREAGVAEPHCNVVIAGYVVDFFWPRQRLVIEVDGYHWHKTRRSFEGDRRKDTKLLLAGIRATRVTQPRIEQDPRELITEVSRLLSGGPAAEQGRADP